MPSLNEIFGKSGEKQSSELGDLKDLLGEKMPELPYNSVGRIRLMKALKIRFGDGFRNIPKIKSLISQFDDEIKHDLNMRKVKKIKLED